MGQGTSCLRGTQAAEDFPSVKEYVSAHHKKQVQSTSFSLEFQEARVVQDSLSSISLWRLPVLTWLSRTVLHRRCQDRS